MSRDRNKQPVITHLTEKEMSRFSRIIRESAPYQSSSGHLHEALVQYMDRFDRTTTQRTLDAREIRDSARDKSTVTRS